MSLLHPGQRTPSGQRSWRTSAKHLASSSSPERLTKSDAGMIEGSLHEGGNRSAAPIIRSEVPRDRYPLPALNTPEANKSLFLRAVWSCTESDVLIPGSWGREQRGSL